MPPPTPIPPPPTLAPTPAPIPPTLAPAPTLTLLPTDTPPAAELTLPPALMLPLLETLLDRDAPAALTTAFREIPFVIVASLPLPLSFRLPAASTTAFCPPNTSAFRPDLSAFTS